MSKSQHAADRTATARISKLDQLITLLRAPEGTAMPAMMAATAWQAHSIRGAMAGSLKRKGHVVISEKIEGERRWRIVEGGSR